jgi:hypothetical protein
VIKRATAIKGAIEVISALNSVHRNMQAPAVERNVKHVHQRYIWEGKN